jgi:hypothetical protein
VRRRGHADLTSHLPVVTARGTSWLVCRSAARSAG